MSSHTVKKFVFLLARYSLFKLTFFLFLGDVEVMCGVNPVKNDVRNDFLTVRVKKNLVNLKVVSRNSLPRLIF